MGKAGAVCDEEVDACIRTPNDENCDNGLFCDGVNDCQLGTAPVCDDQIACTNDACNAQLDACQSTFQAECVGSNRIWTVEAACSEVACDSIPGACCDHLNPDPLALDGICTDGVLQSDCQGDNLTWTKRASCASASCASEFQIIPTVSEWGLVVLALLLLTGAKLYYARPEFNVC